MMTMLPGDKMGSDSDIQRALLDAQIAQERGFALPDTVVPFGIEVIPEGQDRYRASHKDWDAMPPAREMLDGLKAHVQAERRTDRVVPLRDLRMTEYGELVRRVGAPDPAGGQAEGRVLTEHAWRQLTGFGYSTSEGEEEQQRRRVFPFGASQYLSDPETPKVRRGADVSYHLGRCPESAKTLVRGRTVGPEEQIFALLGPRYQTAADAHRVAELLQSIARRDFTGARGECLYKGGRWSLDILWHSCLPETSKVVAGEVFKAGIRVDSADDGSRGIRVRATLQRNLCRNFLILGSAEREVGYTTHARRELGEWLLDKISDAKAAIKPFAENWGQAYKTALLGASKTDPGEAFGKLVEVELLSAPEGSGLTKEEYVDRLVAAHRAEGGYTADPRHVITVADAVNAVSRAAHTTSWSNPWMVADQEEQAGALYQEVRVWRSN